MRRRVAALRVTALLVAAGFAAVAPRVARAQDSVVVSVGGEIAGTTSNYIAVPVTVDLRAAPGRLLGAYRLTVRWNSAVLPFYGTRPATAFAVPQFNTDSSGVGMVEAAALYPAGASGIVELFSLLFYPGDTTTTAITLEVEELVATSASVTPFEDLMPLLRTVNGAWCGSLGRWGDVDADGQSNSRDALAALTAVVGLPPGAGMTPALADVDADGVVSSRDALVILSYAVGLPVDGYRVLVNAAGACATGSPTQLVLLPDTVELIPGQDVAPQVEARDAQGRPVLIPSVTWRTRDATVAAGRFDPYYGSVIEGRAIGVTTLIAELGGGLKDSMTVIVSARRRHYVDARARNAPVQTGSARHPFAFISDALETYSGDGSQPTGPQRTPYYARDGDTILVASGTYEEAISANDVSVVILGDSINRPVLDVRGYQYWYPGSGYDALYAWTYGDLAIAHLIVRGGGLDLSGHNVTVRNVRLEQQDPGDWVLEVQGDPSGSDLVGNRGRVLLDSIDIDARGSYGGINVDEADSVEIRNSIVRGDTVRMSRSCGPYGEFGIVADDAVYSWIHDNVVDGSACNGIGVLYPRAGARSLVERNRVTRVQAHGVLTGGRFVYTRHNVVQNIHNADQYSERAGIRVASATPQPDSVVMIGDSVIDVGGPGIWIPQGAAVDVDSAVVDGAGLDSVYYSYYYNDFRAGGVIIDASLADMRVRHTRVNNVQDAISGIATGIAIGGNRGRAQTVGNRVSNVQAQGIVLYRYCGYYGCFAGDTMSVDSATLQNDTIIGTGVDGLFSYRAGVVIVDGLTTDQTAGAGVYGIDTYWTRIVDADIHGNGLGGGIRFESGDSLEVVRSHVVNQQVGVYLLDAGGVYMDGALVDSSSLSGVNVLGLTRLTMDSSAVVRAATDGMVVTTGARANVRRTRFENNFVGVRVLPTADSVFVRLGSFIGNLYGGVLNEYGAAFVVYADTNWWGSPLGPSCDVNVGTCNPGAGDSVLTQGVDFSGYLTAVPITGAPQPGYSARPARSTRPVRVSSAMTPGSASVAARGATPRPPVVDERSRPRGVHEVRPSWQQGRQPRMPTRPVRTQPPPNP